MENVINGNIRILIGQELGEVYLIIQKFINNSWQHIPNNKYRGNYSVDKKIKELLIGSVHSIRRNSKSDMVKFRIDKNAHVYISDYSMIKDYPELKTLNKALVKGVIGDKVSTKVTLVRTKHKQLSQKGIIKIVVSTCLSIGILETLSYLHLENENQKFLQKINNLTNLSINQSIINNDELEKQSSEGLDIVDLKESLEAFKSKIITSLPINLHVNYKNDVLLENLSNEIESEKSATEQMIQEYANMYFMDYKRVNDIYNDNYDEINNSDNPELTFILKVKDTFYLDETIDKEPIVTNLTPKEKEECIINMAKDIYKVEDEDTLALLLAIHRIEADWGESDRCIYTNNPGGVKEGNTFLSFKTFEIGVECFVRNTLKIKDLAANEISSEKNIEYEMQKIYCEGENTWATEVKDMKNEILNNNELDSYLNKDNKKYIKK